MEILIPGLILVALMAWASTRIKKRAADAFEAELIETDNYSLRKPEGFLHVIGDPQHDFSAHTREFGGDEDSQVRLGTIEIDILQDSSLPAVRDSIRQGAERSDVRREAEGVCEIVASEAANQSPLTAFYKIVRNGRAVYRLRFAVVAEHKTEFSRKIDKTLDSFKVKTD